MGACRAPRRLVCSPRKRVVSHWRYEMRQRILVFIGVAAVIIAVTVLLKLVPGQAPALETSWGEPDLQGLWSDEYQIPLQRPAKYAGKEFFTDAELAALDKQRASKPTFGDKRAEKGTE